MSAPSSLCLFITPTGAQGADAAAITAPDIEATLLTEEQQVQRDADDLMKALKEANRKCKDLTKKRWDVQVTREKREVDQCEADTMVRGRLLTNAVVAEVWCQFLHQADKAQLVAEKLQAEREVSWLLPKVRMRLGVSVSLFPFIA